MKRDYICKEINSDVIEADKKDKKYSVMVLDYIHVPYNHVYRVYF